MNSLNEKGNLTKLNNQTIREAVELWLENENEAIKLYGNKIGIHLNF